MSDNTQYPDHFLSRLHTIWGEGFLSPGGVEEVGEMLKDVDLTGKKVLDIGFGTGGPTIALAKKHHAENIIGIDVEPQLRVRAQVNIDNAGVGKQIELKIVEPGPLPFDGESFDVVFSKDSMVHISDKRALFEEIMRVLSPGGVLVASDWLSGGDDDAIALLNQFKELAHLTFAMANAEEMESTLAEAGFEKIGSRDRNTWFAQIANYEVEQIEGPLKQQLVNDVGEEIIGYWIKVKKAMAKAASAGGLRPTHLIAYKPVV